MDVPRIIGQATLDFVSAEAKAKAKAGPLPAPGVRRGWGVGAPGGEAGAAEYLARLAALFQP
jgi:hypothetical protein